MNTVEIGDGFEDRCYDLIEDAINNDRLGLSKSSAKIFRKKGYYSHKRKKDIIFDLTIEVWPKGADNYTILVIVECKNYRTKNVPVDDIEEFESKVDQVAGKNVKAIMISSSSFQQGAYNYADSTKIMLIEDREDDYEIILHRKNEIGEGNEEDKLDNILFKFIRNALGFGEVSGLVRLTTSDIEHQANLLLNDYNKSRYPIKINEFQKYLEEIHNINFKLNTNLVSSTGKKIFGCCDVKYRLINIDNSIAGTNRYLFVLGHELGHIFLHSNLRINQKYYESFEDSKYNAFANKHILVNDKQWIEWQANCFSIALILPKYLFIKEFVNFRKREGIRNPHMVYLDNQIINRIDFMKTVNYLSKLFNVSKTSIRYRLNDLEMMVDNQEPKKFADIARNIVEEF